ncbi:DnaJ subfamily C member 9 [Orchesella cincta]|uniref:DnaJ subfamily C member 9 n=1 Tax=Orchesella cincta TaxID=48709 RepID=A0A1D2MSG3_ORCCI|nr:DnaJ subfamily C member 9 [Orchesella cincta]
MDVVRELFETEDLYWILGILKEKVRDERALRSAYMKAALKYHPDKAPSEGTEAFTKKFQIIQKVYELFKDEDRRKVYDQTGTWPTDEDIKSHVSTSARLDEDSILEFQKTYQGSEEERQDIKKYYEEGKGDFSYIFDHVFFLNPLDDEEKVDSIIESLIESGEIKRLPKKPKSVKIREKKLKRARQEAAQAEAIMKKINLGGGMDDLTKMILAKRNSSGSFLADLAKKYGDADAGTKLKPTQPKT